MKSIQYIVSATIIALFIIACGSSPKTSTKEEPVVIKNDSLEYEIIIIDPGFTTYLNTIAKPEGYYSQSFMESRNRMMVPIWNIRANSPLSFDPGIYENQIDYSPHVNYGYEVNYKLFNYFMFAQRKYRMRLGNLSSINR